MYPYQQRQQKNMWGTPIAQEDMDHCLQRRFGRTRLRRDLFNHFEEFQACITLDDAFETGRLTKEGIVEYEDMEYKHENRNEHPFF